MTLWLAVIIVAVVLAALLFWWWRREVALPVLPAVSVLVVAMLVGVLGWVMLGRHPDTATWLSDYRQHSAVARSLIAGQPVDELAGEVPVGVMARVLQRELQRDGSAAGWYGLAMAYEQMQAPEQAVASARQSVRLAGPEAIEPRLLLVRTLMEKADPEAMAEARTILDAVIEAHPEHEGARLMRGVVAARTGDYATAIAEWEAMLARHPDGEAAAAIQLALEDVRQRQAGEARYGRILVTVEARGGIEPGGTLFVFLRAADQPAGQPLAARRILADRFPITVSLQAEHWLQPWPEEGTALVAGARYGSGPGGDVASSQIQAALIPLEARDEALQATLTLLGGSDAP